MLGCTLLCFSKEGDQRNRATKVPQREELGPAQRQELMELVDQNQDVFFSEPGNTHLVQHHINSEPGKKVKLRP